MKRFNLTVYLTLLSFAFIADLCMESIAEENLTKKSPEVFVKETIGRLQKAGKNLREKSFFKPVPPYPSHEMIGQYGRIVSDNIRQFMSVRYELVSSRTPPDASRNLESQPINVELLRKDKLVLFLALLKELRDTIDPNFDENIPIAMNIFPEPDASDHTGQAFLPGMRAEDIKHPQTRLNYEKACWENSKNILLERIYSDLNDLIRPTERVFREHVLNAYSEEPRDDQELIELLEKYEYPMAERVKLLCELNIPYKGFRTWQSTDKLFKTNAKFISLDKDEVTLEKADGKRTTIELSVLRKEDQNYVKEQLDPETKNPKDEKPKN